MKAAATVFTFKPLRKLLLLTIPLVALLGPSSTYGSKEKMSQEKALQMALAASGGFLGTWVRAVQRGDYWFITAISKSAKPPLTYIISTVTDKIVFEFKNADMAELNGKAKNGPDGAMVALAENLAVACVGLDRWPDSLEGKAVSVAGVLKKIPGAESKPLEYPLLAIYSKTFQLKGTLTERSPVRKN